MPINPSDAQECPRCHKKGMPAWGSELWTARACQECGYGEDRQGKPVEVPPAKERQ